MYMRITTFKVEPDRLPELARRVEDMKRLAAVIPGLVASHVAWRADGQGTVVGIYESQERAGAAARRIQAMWGAMAPLVSEAPRVDAYDVVVPMRTPA
ncbi:MAG: hypothetical protein NW223_05010 [Hyphomicrobiaceae bacterium]|nr:hypothetical protein [Hyphomicrobiaceae bacterium]